MFKLVIRVCLPVMLLIIPFGSQAFGVLTHEAIIDAAWEKGILPLLLQKYPRATVDEQKLAHGYAYGGAVAPDMGYYPRGSHLFTDLVHYVRSGEMVEALVRDAHNINQYAFALGFLSHYEADKYGHPLATNVSVPLVYPKIEKEFGQTVTYAQDELSHMRMEFGFDVLEVAKGNYVSQTYREFIGFKIDTAVLAQAFKETYGLDINEIHKGHFYGSVETFRWVVANVFPLITRQAWATKRSAIQGHDSTVTAARFNYKMRQKVYDKDYGTGYKRPGFVPTVVSFLIRFLPKIGPLKALKFKVPTGQAEKNFANSFDTIEYHFKFHMKRLTSHELSLYDYDFDTGKPTSICEYSLADNTYGELLIKLSGDGFKQIPPGLKANMLAFYKGVDCTAATARKGEYCTEFTKSLVALRGLK